MGLWVPCLIVSLFGILLTMFLAEALRKATRALVVTRPSLKLAQESALEFIASAEMCGCAFELVIGNNSSLGERKKGVGGGKISFFFL